MAAGWTAAFAAGYAVSSWGWGRPGRVFAEGRNDGPPEVISGPAADAACQNAKRIFALGNPGPTSDKLMRSGFVVAYDRQKRLPHYVAQVFSSNASGSADDKDRTRCNFAEDSAVPKMFRSRLNDYRNAPDYDRGHLAPAHDMSSLAAQKESFLLTNIAPQHKGLNRGFWSDLESWIRKMSKDFDQVVVYTGPLFLPRYDAADRKTYIKYEVLGSPPNTPVPNAFFKVILALRGPVLHATAFMLPNEPIPATTPLTQFEVPLDAVESATGLEFLRDVDRRAVKKLCNEYLCEITNFNRIRNQIK
ncbi:hypothetical protein DFJ74DRAFT_605971 [Hyaloraphidium curvatum]|nr:hypothetical protein DFJ74DRAFT_605971 [Hyaloraphidium curvatum]